MVARDDIELAALLKQFVTVRCVQMGGVDLDTFQFDPLVSWSVFFMNADKTIYGRFGTAHPQAKRSKSDSNTNHTMKGLKAALLGALDVHRGYTSDAKTWAPKLKGKTGTPWPWRFAEKTPAARKYKRLKRVKGTDTKGCVHCHEVQRVMIDSFFMKKKALPDSMLWMYPHPEIIGLTMSKDHRALVTAVAPGSVTNKLGIKAGDIIETLQGQPLLSVADLQWVLHNAPDERARLTFGILRGGNAEKPRTARLPRNWRRRGDYAWRYRVAGYAMWQWAGATLADHAEGVRIANHAPYWFKHDHKGARKVLRPGDIILDVDGGADPLSLPPTEGAPLPHATWTRSSYLAYLMREKKPGSVVKLKVRRKGKEIDVRFKLPKPRPEVLGH